MYEGEYQSEEEEDVPYVLKPTLEERRRIKLLASELSSHLSKESFPLREFYKKKSTVGRGTYGDVCIYIYKDNILQRVRVKLENMGQQTKGLNDNDLQSILTTACYVPKIAVKKLRPKSDSDETEMKRTKREEENLRRLRHPHVVRLYGSLLVPDDLSRQRLFLIMEPCDGNLRRLCHAELIRQLLEWEIWWIVTDIILGLEFIHEQNIMHRDLKPENVLIKCKHGTPINWEAQDIKELRVKICDFGFSRLVSSSSGVQSLSPLVGTLGYMAPEVLEGGDYHKKADLFSVGVIQFELEHKRRPTKEEYGAVKNGHRVSKYGRLGDLMLRMLQRDPEKRPTANEALLLYGDYYGIFRLWSKS